MQKASKIILGIDPGTLLMGYGLIAVHGSELKLLHMDVLKLSSKLDNYQRLEKIHHRVAELIHTYKPHECAVEAPFFGKNVQSMLKLGRAQGVAIAAAMQAGISVCEYAPKKVKQSITGNGNAGKEQVMKMLQALLKFRESPKYFDATDALAVAVCHYFQGHAIKSDASPAKTSARKSDSWTAFVARNPSRVRKPS